MEQFTLLTTDELADRWKVTREFVRKRTSEDWPGLKLPFIGLGRAKRFRLAQVEEFERFHEGRHGKEEPICGLPLPE